jgi:DNA invertase Pin-like site-specific DNA recombinase
MTKRAGLYCRISTGDQHTETQLYDLREVAKQRGDEIVREYSATISGTPLNIDRKQAVEDRRGGMSLTQVASKYRISRATICRLVNEAGERKKADILRVGQQEIVVRATAKSDLSAAA